MDLINFDLHIKKGETLSKRELKSRLTQMEVSLTLDDELKKFYVDLYDKAMKEPEKINKIRHLLIKDTEEEKTRLKSKNERNNRDSEEKRTTSNSLDVGNRKREKAEDHNSVDNNLSTHQQNGHKETTHETKNNLRDQTYKSEKQQEVKNKEVNVANVENVVNIKELAPKGIATKNEEKQSGYTKNGKNEILNSNNNFVNAFKKNSSNGNSTNEHDEEKKEIKEIENKKSDKAAELTNLEMKELTKKHLANLNNQCKIYNYIYSILTFSL